MARALLCACIFTVAQALTLAASARATFSGCANAWVTAASAVDHLSESPGLLRRASSKIDELTNVKIEGRDATLYAHVALPADPPPGQLPVLILLDEFFGLSDSIVAKAQVEDAKATI